MSKENGRREHFLLTLERDDDGRITALEVVTTDLAEQERSVRLAGFRVPRVIGPLHDLVSERGVASRQWTGSVAIELDQATGAQVELLVRAAKPLRRLDRIDHIVSGVTRMSRDEASYWHVQMTERAGLRALRLLLGDRGSSPSQH
ncbi:MAG: hypothetical protein ABSG95_12570 [Solirubrobacteraceae bacterium]|jgi:hypothetical protein